MICGIDEQIINTYYNDYKFFFSKPNVEGIGFGYKYINNICTKEPCIHVFVTKKILLKCLQCNGIIPPLYKGIKTDVIEIGNFIADDYCSIGTFSELNNFNNNGKGNGRLTTRVRPIEPGYCISLAKMSRTGTLGYIVTDNEQISKTYCILSTATTLSDYNKAPLGSFIIQPAFAYEGKAPNDIIAKLLKFKQVKISNTIPDKIEDFNDIDAGVASYFNVGEVQLLNPIIPGIGVLTGTIKPNINQSVQWTGCLRGNQKGTVISIKAITKVNYNPLDSAYFKDVIISKGTHIMSPDSGALLCDINKKAIGILFARCTEPAIYNVTCTIDNIQNQLKVTLLTFN